MIFDSNEGSKKEGKIKCDDFIFLRDRHGFYHPCCKLFGNSGGNSLIYSGWKNFALVFTFKISQVCVYRGVMSK